MSAFAALRQLPNLLSGYRLLAAPVGLVAVLFGERPLFVGLILVSLVTDILDGWLARALKAESEFGARLDSAADNATYLVAVLGLVRFEQAFVSEHAAGFALILGAYLLPQAVFLGRFGRLTSLHLYSSKVAGYVQGFFFLACFTIGPQPWFFQLVLAVSLANDLEALTVGLLLRAPRSNVRGVYWLLADRPRKPA